MPGEILVDGEPLGEADARVAAELLGLGLNVAGGAGQDWLALRRREGAAAGDDGGVPDCLGQVGEEPAHVRGRLHPGLGRAALAVRPVDLARLGDAEHGVVRGVEMRLGISRGIGCDERQIVGVGEVDQARLGRLLDRLAAPAELDIEAAGEQPDQAFEKSLDGLPFGEQAGERPLPAAGQRDQAVGAPLQRGELDMGVLFDRAAEMRLGDQSAEILVALLVLRVERQPVDQRRLCLHVSKAALRAGPGDAQQRADDRLDALLETGVAERHDAVKPVPVGDRGGGKVEPFRLLRDRLRLHRPLQHGVAGEETQGDVGRGGHRFVMGAGADSGKRRVRLFPRNQPGVSGRAAGR